jgi:hypothetical protein
VHTNFYEKAHPVKSTWRPYVVAERNRWGPSRYASIRTLGEPALLGGSVHYEIRLGSGYQGGAAIFRSVSPLARGRTKFAGAVTSLDPKRDRATAVAVIATRPPFYGRRRCARIITSSLPILPIRRVLVLIGSLSRLLSTPGAAGVAQWLVYLCGHPQAMQ